jgi:hypothetical protein
MSRMIATINDESFHAIGRAGHAGRNAVRV